MPTLSIDTLPLILALLVPGFVWAKVHEYFQVKSRAGEGSWLEAFSLSAINFALWSWRIPSLWADTTAMLRRVRLFESDLMWVWFGFTFLSPAVLGTLTGLANRRSWVRTCLSWLRIRVAHPVDTGWDFAFAEMPLARVPANCVLWSSVTLRDGSIVEGYFGADSLASSMGENHDLYLERQYKADGDGALKPVGGTAGVWIAGSEIKAIEFRVLRTTRTEA